MKMKLILPILAAALLAGCTSTAIYPVDTRVTVAEDLATDVFVRDVRCAKGEGSDFAMFQATLVNNATRTVSVEWRVDWMDAAGFAVASDTEIWRIAAIPPKAHTSLQCVAPTPKAADMRFYVRRLRR